MGNLLGYGECVTKRALIILNNFSGLQDSSCGKFIMHCQPEEGLNPQKSGGFPNPFPSRAEGGSREVEGECVGRVGSKRAIGRAVLGCEVFEVGVKRFECGFYDV